MVVHATIPDVVHCISDNYHGLHPMLHNYLKASMELIVAAATEWQSRHPHWHGVPWCRLPRRLKWAVDQVGSPAWVRCQSVHLHRLQLAYINKVVDIESKLDEVLGTRVVIVITNQHNVLHAYNRYRKRSRVAVNRPVNARNTAVKEQNQQRHRNFFKKAGEEDAPANDGGEVPEETASVSTPGTVGLHTRMHPSVASFSKHHDAGTWMLGLFATPSLRWLGPNRSTTILLAVS